MSLGPCSVALIFINFEYSLSPNFDHAAQVHALQSFSLHHIQHSTNTSSLLDILICAHPQYFLGYLLLLHFPPNLFMDSSSRWFYTSSLIFQPQRPHAHLLLSSPNTLSWYLPSRPSSLLATFTLNRNDCLQPYCSSLFTLSLLPCLSSLSPMASTGLTHSFLVDTPILRP